MPLTSTTIPAHILKILEEPAEIKVVRLVPVRGRAANGKLSDHDVRAIRESTDSLATLSALYGVTRWTISMIRSGRLRKNVR